LSIQGEWGPGARSAAAFTAFPFCAALLAAAALLATICWLWHIRLVAGVTAGLSAVCPPSAGADAHAKLEEVPLLHHLFSRRGVLIL